MWYLYVSSMICSSNFLGDKIDEMYFIWAEISRIFLSELYYIYCLDPVRRSIWKVAEFHHAVSSHESKKFVQWVWYLLRVSLINSTDFRCPAACSSFTASPRIGKVFTVLGLVEDARWNLVGCDLSQKLLVKKCKFQMKKKSLNLGWGYPTQGTNITYPP